jgi:hypothetical protein
MRLPPTITRRWMVLAPVVALAMYGLRLKQRHDSFLARVQVHLQQQAACRSQQRLLRAQGLCTTWMDEADFSRWSHELSVMPLCVAYHEAMADKYRHAARGFWFPVARDPPEPR